MGEEDKSASPPRSQLTFGGPSALLVNAKSRRGRLWFDAAKEELEKAGIKLLETLLLTKDMSLEHEVRRCIEDGASSIIVGGGDGSLRIAAKALLGKDIPLGVLPLGTGNAFARDLGIATNLADAVQVIADGRVESVDVGSANGELFLNVGSVGLSALVATRLKGMPKSILGPAAYVLPLLQAIRLLRPFQVSLSLNGEHHSLEAFQVVVGNGRYHAGPFLLAEDADLTTGQFLIYAVEPRRKSALFRYAIALLFERKEENPDIQVWRTSEATLETRPHRRLVLDGDIRGRTPVRFEVLPSALKVFAPAPENQ